MSEADTYISIDKAKPDKLRYVVANFIIVNRENKTVLLLQRGKDEDVYPGKWGFPGGKSEDKDVKAMIKEQGTSPL